MPLLVAGCYALCLSACTRQLRPFPSYLPLPHRLLLVLRPTAPSMSIRVGLNPGKAGAWHHSTSLMAHCLIGSNNLNLLLNVTSKEPTGRRNLDIYELEHL